MPSTPSQPLSTPPTKSPVRFEISTPAPSEIPAHFPADLLNAMPEWKNSFAYHATFDAVFLAPLTETALPIEVHERFSSYPMGLGAWGENPRIILAEGNTPEERLTDFVERIKAVYGAECRIGFVTGAKHLK